MSQTIKLELDWETLRALEPSARLVRLHQRFQQRYAELGRQVWYEEDEVDAREQACLAAYRATIGQPAILRRARLLVEFAQRAIIRVEPDEFIIGSQKHQGRPWTPEIAAELQQLGYAGTTGHIVHDFETLIQLGMSGLKEKVEEAPQNTNLAGFKQALDAFMVYLQRHAEARPELRALTDRAPATFAEGLQLVWLAQCFLHAENPSAALSFGRLDQHLWPLLDADLLAGRLTSQEAFDLVGAFLIKCCEGEESQNLVLGGVDETGADASNPLSLLFLAAMKALKTFQPSLTVRWHDKMAPDFAQAAAELAAVGTGNPGFMNDAVVIAGLEEVGIPLERARDWAVVGCYEACPDGDSYPNTVLARLNLVEALYRYLSASPSPAPASFEELLAGWIKTVQTVYTNEVLPACQAAWNHFRDHAPSPFGSLLLKGCLDKGLPLEAGAAPFNLVGINILGLGTVVDSLHVLRELVFDRHEVAWHELVQAVSDDFADETLRALVQKVSGRYGEDKEATNSLAAEVSTAIAQLVLRSRLEGGVRPYPGFFAFGADILLVDTPSPDGRRKGDLISYGVAPSSGVSTSPTAAMASAAHAAQNLAACGNPFALTLDKRAAKGTRGIKLIWELVATYFSLGGSHLHFNLASADEMRRAQTEPQRYRNLTVRISGFSARFVQVAPRLQNALIERAEKELQEASL